MTRQLSRHTPDIYTAWLYPPHWLGQLQPTQDTAYLLVKVKSCDQKLDCGGLLLKYELNEMYADNTYNNLIIFLIDVVHGEIKNLSNSDIMHYAVFNCTTVQTTNPNQSM